MSADYAPAQWVPTDHCGGWVSTFQPRWVIIHGTSDPSPAVNIARYFQTNDPPSSTHYIVDRDGTVVQCVSEAVPAWGNGVITAGHDPWWPNVPAGNPNSCTLSIEHVKPQGNVGGLTDAQKAASFALVKHLVERHGIPLQVAHTARPADANGGVTAHASIDPVNRAMCPGDYPWQELADYLGGNTGGNGGQTTVANTQGLGPGLAALANQENSDAASVETPLNGRGDTYARLANGNVIWWDNAAGVGHTDQSAHVVAGLEATIAGLKAQLAAAKTQPAPTPTPVPAPADPQTVADAQSWRAFKAAVGLLVAK